MRSWEVDVERSTGGCSVAGGMKLKPDAFACTVLTAVKLLGWKNKAKTNLAKKTLEVAASASLLDVKEAANVSDAPPRPSVVTKLAFLKNAAETDASAMLSSKDGAVDVLKTIAGTGSPPSAESDRAAVAVAALQGGHKTVSSRSMVEKARKRIEKSQKTSAPFKAIVGKYWAAMTDNDNLASVTFSLYQKVHIRISKTLAPDFTEQDAKDVARDDFRSDTGGGRVMTLPQLTDSLYELACLFAKAQLEQLGLKCETAHLVYFLTEVFKNIAEELIEEARRLVSLRDLAAIEDQHNALQTSFRSEIKGWEQKKATMKQMAAAKQAKRAMELQAVAGDEKRKRAEMEAQRVAEEEASANAQRVAQQMASERVLQDWQIVHGAAEKSVHDATDHLRAVQRRREGLLAELDLLLRTMAQLDATRVRSQLARQDTTAVINELRSTREVWERKNDALFALDQMLVDRRRAVEEAQQALARAPDKPLLADADATSVGDSNDGHRAQAALSEWTVRLRGWSVADCEQATSSASITRLGAWSPPVSPPDAPRVLGAMGSKDASIAALQSAPSVVCLHLPTQTSNADGEVSGLSLRRGNTALFQRRHRSASASPDSPASTTHHMPEPQLLTDGALGASPRSAPATCQCRRETQCPASPERARLFTRMFNQASAAAPTVGVATMEQPAPHRPTPPGSAKVRGDGFYFGARDTAATNAVTLWSSRRNSQRHATSDRPGSKAIIEAHKLARAIGSVVNDHPLANAPRFYLRY